MQSVISIAIGAILGAILRWKCGEYFNPIFPTIPLGTLLANLLGCFIMGSFVFFINEHSFFSYDVRLGVITGFLGSLTTFSTFSAEAVMLLARQELYWFATLVLLHVGGGIAMVTSGYIASKYIFQAVRG